MPDPDLISATAPSASGQAAGPDADLFGEPSSPEQRRAGRPAGARNLRSNEVAEYYLTRFGDPLEVHLRLGMANPAALIRELQAIAETTGVRLLGKNQSLKDLLTMQADMRKEALLYLRQRLPVAIEIDTKPRDVLIVGQPTPQQRDGAARLGIDLDSVRAPASTDEQSEQFQPISAYLPVPIPAAPFPPDTQGIDNAGQSDDHPAD